MFCINCAHPTTAVKNSRPHKSRPQVWRRRGCTMCDETFTTYERPSLAENRPVIIPSGSSEQFNIGKLIISISQAFQHAPKQGTYQALWLAQTVEDTLSTQPGTITPEMIAQTTYDALRQFDALVGVQFAAQHGLITTTRKRSGRPSLRERGSRTDASPYR